MPRRSQVKTPLRCRPIRPLLDWLALYRFGSILLKQHLCRKHNMSRTYVRHLGTRATRDYEMCNVDNAPQCEHQVTFKLDIAQSVVACSPDRCQGNTHFWSENGVSCPHERNKIGDSVLWSETLASFRNNNARSRKIPGRLHPNVLITLPKPVVRRFVQNSG
jgi:hypothetical protein